MADMNDDELLIALGVEPPPQKSPKRTPQDEHIIAGFKDILHFYQTHGRPPQHGEKRDIFERLYAVRLDHLRRSPEARVLLSAFDELGLLSDLVVPFDAYDQDEDALLAELGVAVEPIGDDIRVLRHVRSHIEIKAAEKIANRTPCKDFVRFSEQFAEVKEGLHAGTWVTKSFTKGASIQIGDFYIIGGQIAYVAEMNSGTVTKDGRENPRLRVIFDNQTEADLLLRSLSRSLYPDGDTPVGLQILKNNAGPFLAGTVDTDDIETGTIYVLRSHSDHPFVKEHRELIHKIGVTGGKVETRIATAAKDATYLLADVEVVATYKLHNVDRTRLENIFHRIFGAAQLDLTIEDRFGFPVKPKEWFLVPLHVIDEAVQHILDGSITYMIYDPASVRLVEANTDE